MAEAFEKTLRCESQLNGTLPGLCASRRRSVWVESGGSIATSRAAGIGATSPLARLLAKAR